MVGTLGGVTAAPPSRRIPVRLLAVPAALVGIALMHGLQCKDGMPALPMAHAGVHSIDTTASAGDRVDHLVTDTLHAVKTAADAAGDPVMLGGVLAACMVAILTWLAVSTLRPPRATATAAIPIRAGPTRAARAALPRAPTLAQLCVLRT